MSLIGNYFDEKSTVFSNISEELKHDLIFSFDGYHKPEMTSDLGTVANLIQTLLLLKPGTYPDSPDMGIDIAQYMFDLMSERNMNIIKTNIEEQIEKYLPTIYIRNMIVKNVSNESLNNALGLGFDVSPDDDIDNHQNFFIVIYEQNETREIKSQLIF